MRVRKPVGLDDAGRRLWESVAKPYDLRPDELRILESACRAADLAVRLAAELESAPLMVVGSTGQERANPLIAELRGCHALIGSLLGRLKLPDDPVRALRASQETSRLARKAARERWSPASRARRNARARRGPLVVDDRQVGEGMFG